MGPPCGINPTTRINENVPDLSGIPDFLFARFIFPSEINPTTHINENRPDLSGIPD